jgi:hypothetical protein
MRIISADFVEVTPSWRMCPVSTLPAPPAFIVVWAETVSATIDKAQRAPVLFRKLLIFEGVQKKPNDEVVSSSFHYGGWRVRLRVPFLIELSKYRTVWHGFEGRSDWSADQSSHSVQISRKTHRPETPAI